MIPLYCTCGEIKQAKQACRRCGRGGKARKSKTNHNYAWDKLSRRIRRQRPVCEVCTKQGRTTASTEVHHIVSVEDAPDRLLDETNLVAVCHECHEELEGRPLGWGSQRGKRPGGGLLR